MDHQPIMLVEDNVDHQELIQMTFRQNKVQNEIVIANDGVEALDYLFATGSHAGRGPVRLPALIILDLKLPKIDGVEVLARIRQAPSTRYLPTVVLSSSAQPEDVRRALDAGANSYVQKPVDFDQFLDRMRKLYAYWLEVNEAVSAAD